MANSSEDLHLDAERMSLLVRKDQVDGIEADAKSKGFHIHINALSVAAPVEAGPGEVWVTICTGVSNE